ncbi:hypothetical protein F5Y15DRAFT_416750 [Xylariaceae sp. FL0016]|nr:hypothetical protein F5Y15DRAFT_416750 [Xylariaceae sp. FL0016]
MASAYQFNVRFPMEVARPAWRDNAFWSTHMRVGSHGNPLDGLFNRPSQAGNTAVPRLNNGRKQTTDPVLTGVGNYIHQSNYRGSKPNVSVDIYPKPNTLLWITNLHRNDTIADLLGSIRGCGKVYAAHINPPTGNHIGSAQVPHPGPRASRCDEQNSDNGSASVSHA